MELCPAFKIGKKYHPDFAEVPSCQVKIVVRILPVMRSSARLIFQGPLSYTLAGHFTPRQEAGGITFQSLQSSFLQGPKLYCDPQKEGVSALGNYASHLR